MSMGGGGDGQSDRKRKRKSRWAQEEVVDKTIIPGMPTVLPCNLSKEQERQYICKFEKHVLLCGFSVWLF